MGKTYRRSSDGGYRNESGQKKISTRPKTRSDRSTGRHQTARQRQIVATAVHRDEPDLRRFGRAVIESAMRQAEVESREQTDVPPEADNA